MIADLDETIRELLKDELPIKNSEIEVSFEQPKRENTARWSKPTLNLYLYDLRENNVLRQHQWECLSKGNGRDNLAHLKRSPMRVDCSYMITAWANDPQDEHRLLGRCLLALFRFPILPADRLIGTVRNPPFDIQTRLASHDRLTNPAEVWSSLDNEIRPSVPFIVTLALDPWSEIQTPIMRTLTIQTGQSKTLPEKRELIEETRDMLTFISGTIREKTPAGRSLAGIRINVRGSGLSAITDQEGRFTIGSLGYGEHILEIRTNADLVKETRIIIPSIDGGYDLTL